MTTPLEIPERHRRICDLVFQAMALAEQQGVTLVMVELTDADGHLMQDGVRIIVESIGGIPVVVGTPTSHAILCAHRRTTLLYRRRIPL